MSKTPFYWICLLTIVLLPLASSAHPHEFQEADCNSVAQEASSDLLFRALPVAGQNLGQHFGATVGGGDLIASFDEGNQRLGGGLSFVPGASVGLLNWSRLLIPGAEAFTISAPVPGGTIVAVELGGNNRLGFDSTFSPVDLAQFSGLRFRRISSAGIAKSIAFRVSVGNDSLIALDFEGSSKRGLGIAFVEGAQPSRLIWRRLSVSGIAGITFFKAQVGTGELIAAVEDAASRAAVGLVFTDDGSIGSLRFQRINTNLGGGVTAFQATTPAGDLILIRDQGANKLGIDLTFVDD